MNTKFNLNTLCFALCFISYFSNFSQNKIDLKAVFDIENKQIKITQTIQYYNTSQDALKSIYLNDWNNSFSTKKTPLAIRLADEYKQDFHLAKSHDRGFSTINYIKQNNKDLTFNQLENQVDVIKVELDKALQPNDSYTIQLDYLVQLPNSKFTDYGITDTGDLNLRYWYITPAVYDGKWQYFSNKDLDDLFIPIADVSLEIEHSSDYTLTTELDVTNTRKVGTKQIVTLTGENRVNNKLFLNKESKFKTIETNDITIVSNYHKKKSLEPVDKALIIERITSFIKTNFGEYPHKKLLITEIDNKKSPIYGFNFLPDFVKPYPKNFQYELELLKITLNNYLENILLINPRKEQWLHDGILIYYLINYINEEYPDMKFLGSLSKVFGIRSFHVADMDFNDKYTLAFMIMSRTNKDQPLTMPKDSLLKFNKNIANKYKAGLGFRYLDDYINDGVIENTIESFITQNKIKPTSTKKFETFLKSKTDKNIDWFFTDYLTTRKKIDFKIKNVIKTEGSITLTIKNKENNSMPISLFSLNNDSILSKTWIENISGTKTLTIPRNKANKLVLNYNRVIPEINVRDNWKSLKGFFFNNKPLQLRLFMDIESPNYNQVFFMPIVEYNNIYDGINLGMKIYNKTILRKFFNYSFSPQYSVASKKITGSALISKRHYLENSNLYAINYAVRFGYKSYAENLFVKETTPYLSFLFREKNDFRSNKRKSLNFRYVYINRDKDINNILPQTNSNTPNYGVFNARYRHSDDNLINFKKWYTDLQIAKTFTKATFNYEYRHLFESNRQLNLRFYSGAFLNNNNDVNSNYFSFALDRPTDYLFDYSYLGRSESSGLYSQQYIQAEGGFKSKLKSPYANQWISTINASTTLWKYVLFYGDIGLVKNKFSNPNFVYDSGIRLNLVTDYFEIYFPLYSNLGWEIGQPRYNEKIRFKFTVDPKSLLGLFRRRWY